MKSNGIVDFEKVGQAMNSADEFSQISIGPNGLENAAQTSRKTKIRR